MRSFLELAVRRYLRAPAKKKLTRMWRGIRHVSIPSLLFFLLSFQAEANAYQGFQLLKEEVCKPLPMSSLMKLPEKWNKYGGFIKECALNEPNHSIAKVNIISIWTEAYYKARFPAGPHKWEDFPLPIIVDDNFSKLGELPEIYPSNDITSPDVYFGKWDRGIPREIRVDVSNPAVEGDYYYPPLLWDAQKRVYRMKGQEVKYGRRR